MEIRREKSEDTAPAFTGWEQLYILANHWKSDLEFYKEDLRFLHLLVDKYILWVTLPENSERVREIETKLFELRKQCKALIKKVSSHTNLLARLIEKSPEANQQAARDAHLQLEELFAHFVKQFRKNRKETFIISEYVIDSESLAHIIE